MTRSGRPRLRALWAWGPPAVLLPAALALNPSEDEHLAVLREAIAAQQRVAASFPAAERADPRVRYTSLWLCSYTRRDHVVTTFGAFGQVVAVGRRAWHFGR